MKFVLAFTALFMASTTFAQAESAKPGVLAGRFPIGNQLFPLVVDEAAGTLQVGDFPIAHLAKLDFKSYHVLAFTYAPAEVSRPTDPSIGVVVYVQQPGGDSQDFKCTPVARPDVTYARVVLTVLSTKTAPQVAADSCVMLEQKK